MVTPGTVGPIDNVTVGSGSLPGRVRSPVGAVSPTFPAGNTNLETISSTIALADGGAASAGTPTTMAIEVGALTASQPYKAQLLFFDVFQNFLDPTTTTNKRLFDIVIEGNLEIDNFDIVSLTGSGGTVGALVTHWFTGPGDGILNIALIPQNFPPNFSPLIGAMTVEPVPEPATIARLGIGIAGLAGGAARRKLKNKEVEKS